MQKLSSSNTRNLDQYRQLHQDKPEYGNSSPQLVDLITYIVKRSMPDLKNSDRVLDFGCGKSDAIIKIATKLNVEAVKYDPAIEKYSKIPTGTFKFVINTDVLEHIDEEEVPLILKDISEFSKSVIFNISTRVAKTVLSNGENAHATVRDAKWWLHAISEYFPNSQIILNENDEVMVVTFAVPDQIIEKLSVIKRGGIRGKLMSIFA